MINQFSTGGSREEINELIKSILYGKRADGAIILNMKPSRKVLLECKSKKFPVVLVDEKETSSYVVKTDNFKGAYIATEYLIKKGKKNICIVYGRENTLGVKEKLNGFFAAMNQHKRKINKSNYFEVENYTFEHGINILDKIIKSKKKFDAIFCAAGDIVAMGIIKSAKMKKIKIPKELAIIGYDDIFPASLSEPPLTTVKQPAKELGMEALNIIVQALEEGDKKEKIVVFEPSLIIRESA